jgi:hypothetical protein
MTARQKKITFGEMRQAGVDRVLIYCADYKCSHSIEMYAGQWTDDVRVSDIEPRFTCHASESAAPKSGPIGIRSTPMREKGWSTPQATRRFRGLCPALPI